MKSIVVAYDRNYAIGKNGELPWDGPMSADMRRFRDVTMGNTVIMGRKTFESLPENYRPLPGRQNVVLSLGEVAGTGFQIARSMDEAYSLAERDNINVIGGGQIYKEAINTVDLIFATRVDEDIKNPDTFFPTHLGISKEWTAVDVEDHDADEKNVYGYSFITYLRNHPIN